MVNAVAADARLSEVVWATTRARPWPRILGGVGATTGAIVGMTSVVPILGLLDATHEAMGVAGASSALLGALLGFLFVRVHRKRAGGDIRVAFGARGLEMGGAYLSYGHIRRVEVERAPTGSALHIQTEGGGYVLRATASVIRDLDEGLARLRAANPSAEVISPPR